jgi:hypothetical protein
MKMSDMTDEQLDQYIKRQRLLSEAGSVQQQAAEEFRQKNAENPKFFGSKLYKKPMLPPPEAQDAKVGSYAQTLKEDQDRRSYNKMLGQRR